MGRSKAGCSFLKKRTKRLLRVWAEPFRRGRIREKFFASFFQKRSPSFLLPFACLTAAATIDAGPNGTQGIRAIASLDAAEIGPGTVVKLHAGRYTSPIMVSVSGTKTDPIVIEGAGDGSIDIDGSLVLDHAAFVTVRGLNIVHAGDAGIILRRDSHDIAVLDNDIANTRLGIWIGEHAGDGNRIEGNHIHASTTHGIAIDAVNAAPGRESVIARNRIEDSGTHGIELSGNFYIVEGNIVSGSGRAGSGASGIHVFAQDASQGVGQHNIVRDNISFDNRDSSAQDGNGIQLDQWCDDNVVSHNIAVGNDGAGISVFDAAHARIVGNTLYGNMRDPARSHRHRAELTFASDDEHDVDHTTDGLAESNIIAATAATEAAILVDVPTSRHPPAFSHNLLWNAANGDIARWAGHAITDIAAWNRLASHHLPDVSSDPGLVHPTASARESFRPARGFQGLGAVSP